jgi:DNA helicase IV
MKGVLALQAGHQTSVDPLTTLIARFFTVFKASGKDMADLRHAARAAKDGGRTQAFLDVFEPVLASYMQNLHAKHEIDFNDMINQAVNHLESGRYRSLFRCILVDEFQDISVTRADLLRALLRSRPNATLFCVGDDWQSIYRFTGSDITLTSRFHDQFPPAHVVALDRTFRFNN